MAEDIQYFIVTSSASLYSTIKPGRICCSSILRYKEQGPSGSRKVRLLGSYNYLDYPVEVDRLKPISNDEAGLLMALKEEDRLAALNQGLTSALKLQVGTEVQVQHNKLTLGGIIRYIGNIKEPKNTRDLPGVFYGIELQGSDRGKGDTDGKAFFSCDKKCGLFVPFNRITAVTLQTSPGPLSTEGSDLKLTLSLKSTKDPNPGFSHDLKQPLSFVSSHFQDPQQKEAAPPSSPENHMDSGPKSLSADPVPMDRDHIYEDPDQLRDPAKGHSKGRCKSLKGSLVSDMFKTEGKEKHKPRFMRPGSARRAPVSETPEDREENDVKSLSKPEKNRLANSRARLRLRSQSLSECGSSDILQTGDQVMFFDEKEKTVKGTFIYMLEKGGESVACIKVDSGMSIQVPLVELAKIVPEAENICHDSKGPPIPAESRPENRPKLEERDHKKSWSEVVKSRPDGSRGGLGLKSNSDSKTGSLDPLQTGDHVMFVDEEENTVKGTFIFMTERGGENVAWIKEESGMSIEVPLTALCKVEPEAENLYTDPKGPPISEYEESRPEPRPDREKPGCLKTGLEVDKSRPEAEPAKPRTGAQKRLETGPESPKGPKPGPRHCSTDELTAGDKVTFIDEMERVSKGTVVFVDNTDKGVEVYISGEFGTSRVPLEKVKKELETDSEENLYEGPPVSNVEQQNHCTSLGLHSVVEVDFGKEEKGYGIIRWIGNLSDVPHKMAGLELEKPHGVSNGTFRDQRYFRCAERHALFVKLSSCRPDSRFCRNSSNHSAPYQGGPTNQNPTHQMVFAPNHPNHNGFTAQHRDDSADLEPFPPVAAEDVERLLVGRMKGIQGHHNSCYMDSALFSLFSVSSVLDSLLYKSTPPKDAEVQRILLRDIVNPLRRDGFVYGHHIMNLRKQLQQHGFSNSFTTDEKDPEEFLTVIMQHILNLDPLLKLSSGGKVQDSFCFQIFLDQSHDLVLPSVQQLLEHSFQSNALRLSEVPSCLILQMPRFGKKFKMFDKILPSLELDMTDLLEHGQKQCCLCADTARWDCPECFLDPTFGSTGLKLFCDQCSRQVHTHPSRDGHHPEHLDTGHNGNSFHGNRDKLHLLAVLCIETSHYVSFVKYGPDATHWLFFDSMADREGEEEGYNVPQVSLAPELGQYLKMSLSELANQAPRDMRGVAKRLLCDAYLYIYQSHALNLYT